MLEKFFENAMWKTRLFVLLPVVFGLIGAIILFVIASVDIFEVLIYTLNVYLNGLHPENFHEEVVSKIIGAVDLYLIAVVMLIFAFGLYELFISKIDTTKMIGVCESMEHTITLTIIYPVILRVVETNISEW